MKMRWSEERVGVRRVAAGPCVEAGRHAGHSGAGGAA